MASEVQRVGIWCGLALWFGLASVLVGIIRVLPIEAELMPPVLFWLLLVLSLSALLTGWIGLTNARSLSQPCPHARMAWWGIGVVVTFWLFAPLHDPFRAKLHEQVARTYATNYMMQIVMAFQSYHDANEHFPSPAICDRDGKSLLSWRVALLPFISQQQLYDRFRLEEPWDSPHNLALLPEMPVIYGAPACAARGTAPGMTFCQAIVGPGAAFEPGKTMHRTADFPDGWSNTVLVVHATKPVPWTKPADLAFDPKGPLPEFDSSFLGARSFWDLGFERPNYAIVGMADGSGHASH